MKIKVWSEEDDNEPTYTVEISNEEIDHFIKLFGEKFGEAFGKAIVKGLEAGD